MSLEKEVALPAGQANAELEYLVDRLVMSAIARIESGALRPFITSKECAQLIGVTPEYLCSMRARSEGPPWSGAGKWTRYERRAALAWLADLPRDNKSLTDDSNDPLAGEGHP
jgi:hypothetical protein